MEANFSGFVIDPAKCSQLSLEEKRELVHEISLWADNAPEILQSWSRRELLQIICAEMGKERKYTGLTKPRMIARLLKLVSERTAEKTVEDANNNLSMSLENQTANKKRRKKEQPLPLLATTEHEPVMNSAEKKLDGTMICQNIACRAMLSLGDSFCRRCSCCICYHYDDNKDPSLWLVCNSDPPRNTNSCGVSCHLRCALKHEKANVGVDRLDGCFYCFYCGKVNGLIGSWRKQLLIAKDARRVDVLCQRISLSHKILKNSERYKDLHAIVNIAVKKLKKEVGTLEKVSAKMARGIVNRLACGAEIQKLCALAVKEADSLPFCMSEPLVDMELKIESPPICHFRFENISPLSVVVSLESEEKIYGENIIGYRLWHHQSGMTAYSEEPTCIMQRTDRQATISGLAPSTEYYFKVSPFSSTKDLGACEARWVTQALNRSNSNFSSHSSESTYVRRDLLSALGEEQEIHAQPMLVQTDSQRGSTNSSDNNQTPKLPKSSRKNRSKFLSLDYISDNNERLAAPVSDGIPFVCSNSDPLEIPRKSDGPNDLPDAANKKESAERDYEYCVRMIRWLECQGHMEKDFRVKFLTWFSLKATVQERRVVKAFIDVLIDEPESLVDQLIDAFMDGICSKEKPALPNGFCTRLWH